MNRDPEAATTPKLYGHPFSSYTWKALIALDEAGVAVEFAELSPDRPEVGAALHALHPLDRFPVLQTDEGVFWESSVIAEWAHAHAARPSTLIPADPLLALRVRELDRIFDGYVMGPMQAVVADAMKPPADRDPSAVTAAHGKLDVIYAWLESWLGDDGWAVGEAFTLADCSALPSLFYADWVRPVAGYPKLAAYLRRLRARPSVVRVVEGARPYRAYFPPGVPDYAD